MKKVAFIGTGGTIASIGVGPLDLQNYGATGNVLHADELLARFPEIAQVADAYQADTRWHSVRPAILDGAKGRG